MAFKMKGSAFKLNNVATKSALEQKLSIAEKLSAAKDAITGLHPESGLGSLYDMYKIGKKSRREEKRKGKMNKEVEPIKRFTKTVKDKTPLEQKQDIKFGYHDDEGSVIADATKHVVPAESNEGVGRRSTGHRTDTDRATYQSNVGDVVRQTAQADWKEEKKAKEKKSKSTGGKKRRSKLEVRTRRPKSKRGINLVTGGTTRTSGRTGRTTQHR